jgi:hypothetical protein
MSISIIFTFISFIFNIIGLIPCLGILCWAGVFFASLALVFGIIELRAEKSIFQIKSIYSHLFLAIISFLIGTTRLQLGAGIF